MIKESIGADLRRMRLKRKLTQEALAHNADVGIAFLKNIEAGRKQPSVTTLFKLALALDVSPAELIVPTFEQWRKNKD